MTDRTEFSDFYYSAPDGLKLHARIYGSDVGGRLPVICLPGLTRNVRDFHRIALYLSRQAPVPRKVVSFDYRGRGLSDYDPDWTKYNVGVEAGDILAGLHALGISSAAFIGTSRGGLILHVLAALRPDVLKALVLNDIGPVLEPEGLALIKSYLSRPGARPATMQQAADLQKQVHGHAFPALDDADWLEMAHSIYRERDGALVPDFDLALLNGLAALDLSQPIPHLWEQFDAMSKIPVLAIRGANSLLLSAETLSEMQRRHPGLEAITVAGQGHAPFLEKGELPARIAGFFDRVEAGADQA